MKLLVIIPTLEFGGAQNIAVGLAEEAVSNGFDITFLVFYGDNPYNERLKDKGIETINLNYNGGFGLTNFFSLRKFQKTLIKKIKEIAPNLIHSHLFLSKLVFFGAKGQLNIPIIDTHHDNSPWWVEGSFKSKLMIYIESYFFKNITNHTVSISKSVYNELLQFTGISEERLTNIYNFIENSTPKKLKKDNDKPFQVYIISRLDWEKKGLDIVVDIADTLVNKFNFIDVKFSIVGDGTDRIKMEEYVKVKGLDMIFDFKGYRSDVYKEFNNADVVLMPSRWEGFGLTAAESAMAGVPVISSNVGGLKEVVLDNKTGFTFDFNQVDDMAEAIIKLSKDTVLYNEISVYAHERAVTMFDKKNAYKEYEKLYILLTQPYYIKNMNTYQYL